MPRITQLHKSIDGFQFLKYKFSYLANYKNDVIMDNLLSILKALSDKNRLRTFCALLSYEELCACQITELLQVAGATVSRHLSLMVNAGILKNRKAGRWIYFRLNTENFSLDPIFKWVRQQLDGSNQVEKDLKSLKQITLIPCEDLCRKQRGEASCPENQTEVSG
ncbi:MAG: metalloregulator ArsR/SmtB family transcription factor [Deltaproteobacteria bacterium]|jgi:ArsR family transcriptional regulator|nr:metalloregulator ArsR/SmtB family transcription factor [Deltaproteobacteria bacterium]